MRFVAVALVLAVVAAGCGRQIEVGPEEAVEVLVLDGVPREKAVCIIDQVDGQIDLARVTGVDPDITDAELVELAAVTAGCRSTGGGDTTTVGADDPAASLEVTEGAGVEITVEAHMDDLVTGGLDPVVAQCVGEAILAASEPHEALLDPNYVTEAIRVCDR